MIATRRLLAALGVCLATAASPAADSPELGAVLQDRLDDFRIRYDFPGATAAVVLGDGHVTTAATGLADVEAQRAMTPGTPMLAASIGKTFVSAMVLALESDGLLTRSDRLAMHLGDRAWFGALPNAETITIAHLLRHQSGLPDHPHVPAFQSFFASHIAAGKPALVPEQLIEYVLGQPPLFAAGSGWAYSDTGYILLGLVIEAVTGQRYYELLRERFLDPLRLLDTVPSDRPDIPGLAVGYTAPDNPFGLPQRTADVTGRLVWDPAVEWTGGGLASTARDLALWGQALFGGRAMDAPYLDRLLDSVPMATETPGRRYGAGVAISTEVPLAAVYGHGGWIPGYVSSLRHYTAANVTVAFQINSDAGILEKRSDLVPALEAALAKVAIASAR